VGGTNTDIMRRELQEIARFCGRFWALVLITAGFSSTAAAQVNELAQPQDQLAGQADIAIVSTEFAYAPAKIAVFAGRTVTIVLDNSGAETEHGLYLPAFDFRLQAKAGEVVRKSAVFTKPGDYPFLCDLPGHDEAGMRGLLSVKASLARH